MPNAVLFAPPGPGAWELELGHHGRRPLTGFLGGAYRRAFETGTTVLLARYGLPLARVRAELVHGCMYLRPIGVGEGDEPSKPPPQLILKLLARIHPELRRRNRDAAQAWRTKLWRLDVAQWFERDRARVIATNLELQAVVLGLLDDHELAAHVAELLTHFEEQATASIANHGGDLMPLGDYLAHCRRWNIDVSDAAALLEGSSPATTEPAELLAPVARAIAAAAAMPPSLDAVRALGPDVDAAVDAWLDRYGWRVVASDDIDCPTLLERPRAVLSALHASWNPPDRSRPPDAGGVRARVSTQDQALFDELLAEARHGLRQRDDVVGIRWNWSVGLLRRALLEVGRRLTDRSHLAKVDDVVELDPDEVAPLLVEGTGPSAAEVRARVARRTAVHASQPPAQLGDAEAAPPLDALPRPMARAATALLAALEADSADPTDEPLHGTGIGTRAYVGRARVVTDDDDALDRLEPGDVLVAPLTGPVYNSLLPIVGGLVVEIGGPTCHAAIAARELGIPALIGAASATTQIPDGATVEVDPTRGVVRIVH